MTVPGVIDTSALLAILLGEPERGKFSPAAQRVGNSFTLDCERIGNGDGCGVARGEAAGRELDLFLHRTKIEMVRLNAEQFSHCALCVAKIRKGRHPAALNFGDCFAYALTKTPASRCLPRARISGGRILQLL